MSVSPIKNHPKQLEVWKDKNRFRVTCCGRRFGKTFLAIEELLKASDKKRSLNVYVAPTRLQAKDIVWQDLKRRFKEMGWKTKVNESELKITRLNGAKVLLRSAEKPDRLRGLGIDFIVFDEFAEYRNKEIWAQVVRPALSDKKGRALFTFTPKGLNHAYELYQNAKTEKDWSVYSFKTIDSPFFQTEEGRKELEDARANLSEKDFKQEYEASFETYSGRIYYAFDRVKCNTDYNFRKDNGPIIIGQDFNRSPMASALYQEVGGILYQFGEIFHRVGNTEQTCEEISRLFPSCHVVFAPDASGRRLTSNSALSDFDIIKRFGYYIESEKINPRRIDRWASVNNAYEKGLVKVNVSQCPVTVKDRENLCYKEGSCEPDTKDPMAGHMSDACDYPIARRFPIITKKQSRVQYYA